MDTYSFDNFPFAKSGCVTKFAKHRTIPQPHLIPFVSQLMTSSECRAAFFGLPFITTGRTALPESPNTPLSQPPSKAGTLHKIFAFT